MQLDDKLEYFRNMINLEAEEQRRKLMTETDDKFRSAAEDARKDAERRADKRVQTETYKIETYKNKEIINATVAAKKSAIDLRDHLIDEIFGNVAAMLAEFVTTDDYRVYLKKTVLERVRQYPNARVVAAERDLPVIAELSAEISPERLDYEAAKDDFIGGFKVFLPDRNAIEDYTFKARVNEEKKTFNKLYYGVETEEEA